MGAFSASRASVRAWRCPQQREPGQSSPSCPAPELVVEVLRPPGGPPVPSQGPVRALASHRDPRSCTYAQLEETVSFDLAEVLATTTT